MNTFNYNTSNVNHYVTTDLGSLGDAPTSIVDNGETAYDLVVSGDYIVTGDILVNFFNEEDYQEINFTETTYPFGTFKVSNTTDSAAAVVFISKPEPIKLYQKAIVVRKQAWTGSGTLFEIADGRERMVAPWIGSSGPLRVSGGAESSVTHKFTEDTINTYGSSVDYGLVPAAVGSSISYGQVTDIVDEGEFDNGDILLGDGRPYGLFSLEGFNSSNFRIKAWAGSGNINISGQESSQLDEPTPQIYVVKTSKLTGVGLNIYNSINPDSFTRATYQGSGSLFEIGQKDERAVFAYDTQTVGSEYQSLQTEDYQTINQSAGTTENYGPISSTADEGELNYGEFNTELTKFGAINVSGGDRAHANPRAYRGESEINIRGNATVQFVEPAAQVYVVNGSGVLTLSGTMPEQYIIGNYNTTGSFFTFGKNDERAVFDYNDSSIEVVQDPTDNGSLSSFGSTSDYGQITQPSAGEANYGQVVVTETTRPFGRLFEVTGGDRAHSNPRAYLGATAEIRITGGYSNLQFTSQAGESTVLFNTSGGDTDSFSRPFIGSGSLFHIGDRVEKAVYAYNSSSIITYEELTDSGSITNNATQFADYGSVDEDYYPNNNYGSILVDGSDLNPLGKLFEIGGSASEEFFPTFNWNRPSPPIRIFNEQQDPADFRFRPHWRTDTTTTNPPKLRNAPDGEFNTYAQVRPFIASGSLFHIGDKLESATYDYNESSVVEFTPGGDYGSITSASSSNIDYGAVDGIVNEGEFDNGQVLVTETTQPYVGLFSFQGAAATFFIRGPYSSKGGIRIFNEQQDPADFTFRPHWRSRPYEQGKLTGNAETPRTRPFIGSGSLFHIGDKIEKAVFTYNNSSIETVETAEDYQSITSNVTSNIDYGAVDGIVTEGEFNNGQLVITETTQPFGLFNITGDSVDKWQQCFTKIGSGSLFSFNGGIESRTDDYPETTVLFNFTGNLTESFGKGLYTGSGSLFHIGDRIEKAVFSYTTESIRTSYVDSSIDPTRDSGRITDAASINDDYGSVGNEVVPPVTNYGSIFDVPGTENPFGLFKITGGDSGHKQTFREVFSGTLFGIGNAAEAAVWQTPEETFLLKMRGGAVEKHVENWVGSGTIKYPEDTPLAPNAAVRFRPHWRGRSFEGPITLSGIGGEFFRGSYIGNKSNVSFKILTPNEGFEWRQYRPSPRYVNSVYGKIGGSANVAGISVSQKVNVYGYYGDDRDPGTSGSLFTFNSATEVAGYNPVTDTVLYTASGTAASKWNPAWTSRPDGSPRLSGTPELQLRFNIFTNPEVEVFKFDGTPDLKISLTYNGSGTLFTTNGSSEVLGFNPSTDTVLFRASGTPLVLFSLLHIGSGSLFGFGSAAEARTILAPESTVLFIPSGSGTENFARTHEGSGTNIVSGTVEETLTNAYQGEGSLFSAGSAAEVTAISEAESTVLFKASGGEANAFVRSAIAEGNVTISDNLDEAFARPYAGEGSLFGFNGAAEAVAVDEEFTGLFNFIGDANIVRDRSFVGAGSLFGIGGASEASVISPDLETGLFEITGSAVEIRARSFTPDGGETFVYGDGGVVSTRIYSGKGSLFGIGGATESTTTNLPQNTLLYTVEGRGVVTRARDFAGSESIFISGNAIPVAAVVFTGSGTLSTFNGAAESRTITSESTVLFKPSGSAAESFTEGNYDASGSATISGEASDIKNTRSETAFAYVSTNGKAIARQTYAYIGTGTFSTFNGAAEARAIDIETPGSVNLFTVVGNNPGSVTRVTQPETAKFVLSGASVNVLKLFSPIRIFSTII